MIAENNPILTEISEAPYAYNADELTRQRSQARAEYIAHERAVNRKLAKLSEENAVLIAENQALAAKCQTLVDERQTLAAEIALLRAELAKYKTTPDAD